MQLALLTFDFYEMLTIFLDIHVSCNFDDPFICGYKVVDNGDKFKWMRWNKHTYSSYTGPAGDHTSGDINGKTVVHN